MGYQISVTKQRAAPDKEYVSEEFRPWVGLQHDTAIRENRTRCRLEYERLLHQELSADFPNSTNKSYQ